MTYKEKQERIEEKQTEFYEHFDVGDYEKAQKVVEEMKSLSKMHFFQLEDQLEPYLEDSKHVEVYCDCDNPIFEKIRGYELTASSPRHHDQD